MPTRQFDLRWFGLALVNVVLLLAGCSAMSVPTTQPPPPKVSILKFSVQHASLDGIAAGSDGAIWFTNIRTKAEKNTGNQLVSVSERTWGPVGVKRTDAQP